jgi:hypothetical protein
MQNDVVKISLTEDNVSEIQSPDWNNFWAIPTKSPHLREFISSTTWNCANKILKIEISETPSFSAYNWFSNLTKEDAIAICFFDRRDKEVMRLLFHALKLIDHKCIMNKNERDDDNNELIHEIILSYVEINKFNSELKNISGEDWEMSNSETILAEIT